jgi:hypothetical protein
MQAADVRGGDGATLGEDDGAADGDGLGDGGRARSTDVHAAVSSRSTRGQRPILAARFGIGYRDLRLDILMHQ